MIKGAKRTLMILVALCAMVFSVPISTSTSALTPAQNYEFGLNNILFYDPGGASTFSTATSYACTGDNMNYAGDKVWTDAEMEAISANQPIYDEAASQFGFPWQVMATLHSMETGLRRYNPGNGQGVYQLYSYTDGGTNDNRFEPASSISEEEFRRQTLIAAEVVNGMVGDLNEPDNVKRLFFRYNGTAEVYIQKALNMGFTEEQAKNGDGSAYIMNRYDAQRDPTSAEMSPYWPGRFTADREYTEGSTTEVFGAFVKYMALGETSCTNAGGTIADTALLLSWEGRRSHDKNDPKLEYVEAMKQVGAYIQGNGYYPYGASCDQFVGTVMRFSGADENFPIFGPGVQKEYMDARPEMYQKVETNEDFTLLQPGDIFVTVNAGKHIYMYVGVINGEMTQASASADDRTAEHYGGAGAVYFTDSGISSYGYQTRYYEVYRRINYD